VSRLLLETDGERLILLVVIALVAVAVLVAALGVHLAVRTGRWGNPLDEGRDQAERDLEAWRQPNRIDVRRRS
jgi:hypothetical protein